MYPDSIIIAIISTNYTQRGGFSLINKWDEVLSLDLTKEKTHGLEEEYIKEMIEKRTEAKKNKDFALADSIREELLKQGIILKDTREGTIWNKI